MIFNCPGCKKPIIKEDRRKREKSLVAMNGAKILVRQNEAPRIRCLCGKLVIFIRGSMV